MPSSTVKHWSYWCLHTGCTGTAAKPCETPVPGWLLLVRYWLSSKDSTSLPTHLSFRTSMADKMTLCLVLPNIANLAEKIQRINQNGKNKAETTFFVPSNDFYPIWKILLGHRMIRILGSFVTFDLRKPYPPVNHRFIYWFQTAIGFHLFHYSVK